MQIELSPEVESKLVAESAALGISPVELSIRVIAQHVDQWQPLRRNEQQTAEVKSLEELVLSMKRRNPKYDTTDPFDTDWQALMAEGRRY